MTLSQVQRAGHGADGGTGLLTTEPQAPPPTGRGTTLTLGRGVAGHRSVLSAVAVLLLLDLVVWAGPVLGDFTGRRLAHPGDAEAMSFYLAWNVHAVLHLQDPFVVPNLFAPLGMALGTQTSIPSVSLLVAPVTLLWGTTAAYNVATLLAIFLVSLSVYLLAYELTRSRVGAVIAGALMVVSPYVVGHLPGHLNLEYVFGLPAVCYLAVRFIRHTLSAPWLAAWVALIAAFTAGASTEVFVTTSLFLAIALLVTVVFGTPWVRTRLRAALAPLALGGVLGGALAFPVILAGLRAGVPEQAANPPDHYSVELTNLLVPTGTVALSGGPVIEGLRSLWPGNAGEQTAYLPISLLVIVVVVALAARTRRLVLGLVTFAVVGTVLAFGPVLWVTGQRTLTMPWSTPQGVGVLHHVLPGRFTAFTFMALCLLVAYAWSRAVLPRPALAVGVLLTGAFLWPSHAALDIPMATRDPDYVTSGRLAADLGGGQTVLVLPAGNVGPGLRWLSESDFAFSMPTGIEGGAVLPAQLSEPVVRALYDQRLDYPYEQELAPYLRRSTVTAIVVPTAETRWREVVERSLGVTGVDQGGVVVYRLG